MGQSSAAGTFGITQRRQDNIQLDKETSAMRKQLTIGQGMYFFLTGIWPLLHMPSFEALTGPKADKWLVKNVGILVAVEGLALLLAWKNGRENEPELALIAAGSAAGLGLSDTIYALRGRISKIYLMDALVEAAIVSGWLRACRRS